MSQRLLSLDFVKNILRSVRRSRGDGIVSMLDQGLISGSQFGMSLLLARMISPLSYGAFAIAFAIFLFLSGFHNSLILEPMTVLGASRVEDPEYFPSVLTMNAITCGALSCIMAIASIVTQRVNPELGSPLMALAASTPFILSFWVVRRICYIQARPKAALSGSALYFLVLCIIAALAHWTSSLDSRAAFLAMGIASGIAGFIILRRLGIPLSDVIGRRQLILPEVLRSHWAYGKWVVGTGLAYWGTSAVYTPLLAVYGGLREAAALRAAENLTLPMTQIMVAWSLLVLPRAALIGEQRSRHSVLNLAFKAATAIASIALLYAGAIIIAGPQLMKVIYRSPFYDSFSSVLVILSGTMLLRAIGDFGLAMPLKAIRQPRGVFLAAIGASICTFTVGVAFIRTNGVKGAALGSLLSALVQLLILLACFIYELRQLEPSSANNQPAIHPQNSQLERGMS